VAEAAAAEAEDGDVPPVRILNLFFLNPHPPPNDDDDDEEEDFLFFLLIVIVDGDLGGCADIVDIIAYALKYLVVIVLDLDESGGGGVADADLFRSCWYLQLLKWFTSGTTPLSLSLSLCQEGSCFLSEEEWL
jgi:hypothetical protein